MAGIQLIPSRLARSARGGRGLAAQDGGVALEFGLIAPVLLLVLMGIIQFGFAFYLQANMANAARDAARRLAVGEVTVGVLTSCPATADSAQEVACDYLSGWGGMTFTVTACDADTPCASGPTDVEVTITVPRSDVAIADILGLFGSGNMVARVTMRDEEV